MLLVFGCFVRAEEERGAKARNIKREDGGGGGGGVGVKMKTGEGERGSRYPHVGQ